MLKSICDILLKWEKTTKFVLTIVIVLGFILFMMLGMGIVLGTIGMIIDYYSIGV